MNAPIVPRFSLVDHHGHRTTEADFHGRAMLVYFGFTHCKVVCPRSLGKLSAAIEQLGDLADLIAPLYISVDPDRDRPETMRAYLEANYPRFTGLTGTEGEIDQAKRNFRIFAQRRDDPVDPDNYEVPHTAIAYLIGPDGAYRDHFLDGADAASIARRIAGALSSSKGVNTRD